MKTNSIELVRIKPGDRAAGLRENNMPDAPVVHNNYFVGDYVAKGEVLAIMCRFFPKKFFRTDELPEKLILTVSNDYFPGANLVWRSRGSKRICVSDLYNNIVYPRLAEWLETNLRRNSRIFYFTLHAK